MTDLTLEVLRAELAPIREELASLRREVAIMGPQVAGIPLIHRAIGELRDDTRALRRDVDMLTRITLRVDSTLDAIREDIKSLWLSHGDLRRRIEAIEEAATTPQ
jgi:hypothetical protein